MNKSKTVKALICASLVTASVPCFAQEYLEEVVVTASKVEVPQRELGSSVTTITNQDIKLHGYQSVTELLRTEPGVAVSNSGGQGKVTAIRIRGEEAFRTLVVVDGIDVSDLTGPQTAPQAQHISASNNIEKIEILRGPQGFAYGADAGGVINILSRSSDEPFEGEISMEAGRYNTRFMSGYIASGNENGSAILSLSDSTTNGFDVSGGTEKDGYKNQTVHTKLSINISEHLKGEVVARDSNATNEYDNCGFEATRSNDCIGDYEQTAGRLALSYESNTVFHQVSWQKNNTTNQTYNQGINDYTAKGESQKLEYLGHYEINNHFNSVWGADFSNNEVKPQKYGTNEAPVTQETDYKRDESGVFAELRANAHESLYASLGLRLDDNEDFGSHTSARLSASYIQSVNNALTLKYRSSYGNGFRAPSLGEIAYNGKNGPNLAPLKEETSSGYDLGIEFYLDTGTSAQVTYFNQMIEDEIGFDNINWTGYLQQEGISRSKGVELALEQPIVKGLVFIGNYTYNETLTRDDEQRVRRPKQLANIGARTQTADERLTMLLNIRYSKDSIDNYNVPLKDYSVVDLSATYKLKNEATIFARVENARDKQYQEITGYAAAEAAFYLGIKTPL